MKPARLETSEYQHKKHVRQWLLLAFLWSLTSLSAAAGLVVGDGDVIFGTLATPIVQEQESSLCFDSTSGKLGPCTAVSQALPDQLSAAVCELYLQSSLLIPSFCDLYVEKNDGYQPGQAVNFQLGFEEGEESASTLGPFVTDVKVRRIRFLMGPLGTSDITLKIYEEVGTDDPGIEIFSGVYTVLGSESFLMEIDVTAENIEVLASSSIRVSIGYGPTPIPAIASDVDGNIQAGKNWINDAVDGWVDSGSKGLTGDWIIRAIVEPL